MESILKEISGVSAFEEGRLSARAAEILSAFRESGRIYEEKTLQIG